MEAKIADKAQIIAFKSPVASPSSRLSCTSDANLKSLQVPAIALPCDSKENTTCLENCSMTPVADSDKSPTLSRALPANTRWVPNVRPLSDPRFGARKRPQELSVATRCLKDQAAFQPAKQSRKFVDFWILKHHTK
jgi:hypothetical protein